MSSTVLTRWTWERALRQAQLGRTESGAATLAVALTLATFANMDGTSVRPSQDTVADGLGMHRSTVTRAIGRLRDAGWLDVVREGRPGRPAEYRLAVPAAVAGRLGASSNSVPAGEHAHGSPANGVGASQPQYRTTYQDRDRTPHQIRSASVTTAGEDPWEVAERQMTPWAAGTAVGTCDGVPADDPWAN